MSENLLPSLSPRKLYIRGYELDKRYFDQAIRRFENAKAASIKVQLANTLSDTEDAWGEFINAAGLVFNKLYSGCQGNERSMGWRGRVSDHRKKNPVLNYIHRARNVEVHGLIEVLEIVEESIVSSKPGLFVQTGVAYSIDDFLAQVNVGGLEKRVKRYFVLLTVVDTRQGITTPAPVYDNGATALHRLPTPERVAKEAVLEIQSILDEARSFLKG